MTALHLVGEGRCIALGYECVLPLVLLTLQGGDVKPYEFPAGSTEDITGTGVTRKLFTLAEVSCKGYHIVPSSSPEVHTGILYSFSLKPNYF